MLLVEFYDTFYAPLLLIAANPNTVRQYKTNIKRLGIMLGREAILDDLTRDNITRLASQITHQGRSPATANKIVSQLRALLNEAVRRGMAKHDRLPRLKEYTRAPTAWTDVQMQRLLETCSKQTGTINNRPAGIWWTTLHQLIFDTALRVGAVLKLDTADIDWDRQCVNVPAEIQKDKEDQTIRLHADTLANLSHLLNGRKSGKIFAFDRVYSVIWHRYGKILKEAGLPHTRRDKFHRMRRTTATYFEAAGGDATELLGHSTRETTRRYLDNQLLNRIHPCDVIPRPKKSCPD